MIITIDKQLWYEIEDAIDYEPIEYYVHYADDQDSVGLEFESEEQMAFFVLKFVKT